MIHSIQSTRFGMLDASTSLNGVSGTGKATQDFSKLISLAMRKMQQGANSRRRGDETLPMQPPTPALATPPGTTTGAATASNATPTVGQVVISPFNPLGLPISGTLAPTAAEVAANPAKYAGTSFDPNLHMDYHYPTMRQLESEQGVG